MYVMASFSFNFAVDDRPHHDMDSDSNAAAGAEPNSSSSEPTLFPSSLQLVVADVANALLSGGMHIQELDHGLRRVVMDADAVTGIHNDVVRGVLEGGAKTWECTSDLLQYLRQRSQPLLRGAHVVDLGCGSGLLGIFAMQMGAASILFNDLNSEVLRDVTARNIAANSALYTPESIANSQLLAGSWNALLDAVATGLRPDVPLARRGSVDVILSSETLYRTGSYPTLCALISGLLRPPSSSAAATSSASAAIAQRAGGIALLATKRYYYGVGGGSAAFMAAATAAGLDVSVVASFEDGRSMIRDILQVSHGSTGS